MYSTVVFQLYFHMIYAYHKSQSKADWTAMLQPRQATVALQTSGQLCLEHQCMPTQPARVRWFNMTYIAIKLDEGDAISNAAQDRGAKWNDETMLQQLLGDFILGFEMDDTLTFACWWSKAGILTFLAFHLATLLLRSAVITALDQFYQFQCSPCCWCWTFLFSMLLMLNIPPLPS